MAKNRETSTHKRGPGQPPFQPSDDHRRFVSAMAGLRMTADEMRLLVINPRTQAPISKNVFLQVFAREMEAGKARMKSLIGTKFAERLSQGDAWAIQFGFRHVFGWRSDDVNVAIGAAGGDPGQVGQAQPMLQISFVTPKANGYDHDE